jgi:hypothetical protein
MPVQLSQVTLTPEDWSPAPADEILIFSTGTYSLCLAVSLLKQKSLSNSHVSVFHYEHSNGLIMSCEKWICDLFDFRYLGNLGHLNVQANELLGHSLLNRLAKTFSFLNVWRQWGREHLPPMAAGKRIYVIAPFRPHLSDVFLANLFHKDLIQYVPDGYLMGFPDFLKLPLIWRLARLRNPYSSRASLNVHAPVSLKTRINHFSSHQTLDADSISFVSRKICNDPEFMKLRPKLFHGFEPRECSCLLLQCFSLFKWIDPFEEISLYAQIVRKELERCDATLLIKPHPRDNAAKISLLKHLLSDVNPNRLYFMELDRLTPIPIELIYDFLHIRTFVGLSSTALVAPAAHKDLQVRVYSADWLPQKMKVEIAEVAKLAGTTVIEL